MASDFKDSQTIVNTLDAVVQEAKNIRERAWFKGMMELKQINANYHEIADQVREQYRSAHMMVILHPDYNQDDLV